MSWGSITRWRDGWRVRAGDEKRSSVGVFRDKDFGGDREVSRAAAEEALDEARRVWLSQHSPKGRGLTLVDYGRRLLDRWEKEGRRRGVGQDRTRFEFHIASAPFALEPLGALEHRAIQRWVRKLVNEEAAGPRGGAGKRRSRRTVLNALNLLRSMLRQAIEDDLIDESPARGVIVPRVERTEEDFLLLEAHEVDLIIAARPSERVSLAQLAAFTTAICTGMRPGELWGLRWADVPELDAAGGALIVRHSRSRATKGGRVRRVPLLEPARAILSEWRSEEERRLERPPAADELVWPGPGGEPYGQGYDAGWANRLQVRKGREDRAWTQLGARWNLGVTRRVPLKDLRHTCACALLRGWWVERGWVARRLSMIEIAAWLGHRDSRTTETHYARLAPGGLLDIVQSPDLPPKGQK